jgi:hypothetical protein
METWRATLTLERGAPHPHTSEYPVKNARAIVDGMEIRAKVVRRTDRGR